MATLISGGYTAAIKGALDIIGASAGPQRAPGADVSGDRLVALRRSLETLSVATV